MARVVRPAGALLGLGVLAVALSIGWVYRNHALQQKTLAQFQGSAITFGTDVRGPSWLIRWTKWCGLPVAETVVDIYFTTNSATDRDLAHLHRFVHLQNLYLDGAQVTDDGLVHLKRLKNLQTLYLSGTRITQTAAGKLRRSLPHLTIYGP